MAKMPPKPDFVTQEQWDNLMAVRNPSNIKAGSKAQLEDIRKNGWPDDLETQGGPTILLTVKGRKSGEPRTTPVNYTRDGQNVYVVGSIAGLDRHPLWALNLEAAQEAELELRDEKWTVIPRKLEGSERQAAWPKLVESFPMWGHFQKYCEREFMVFLLTPSNAN